MIITLSKILSGRLDWSSHAVNVFLARNTVAMVTNCVAKMVTTCSSMVGQFFDLIP